MSADAPDGPNMLAVTLAAITSRIDAHERTVGKHLAGQDTKLDLILEQTSATNGSVADLQHKQIRRDAWMAAAKVTVPTVAGIAGVAAVAGSLF